MRPILVLGTSSHSGKSTIVTALCKVFRDRGYDVAPFKAQNMSNNSWVTKKGGEIGISQAVQAWAADKEPKVEMNPVLLKPKGDGVSQVILFGEPYGDKEATEYYEEFNKFRKKSKDAYEELASENDVLVCEGAGGAAEINLKDRDLSNIETARFTDAKIILVTDIERGGAFASIYGTVELIPSDVKEKLEGIIINKFRGTKEVLEPGIKEIEELTGVPVLGVMPHTDLQLPSEDSLSIDDKEKDNSSSEITIKIIRLPHISNFTDFEPLEMEKEVSIEYIDMKEKLGSPDLLILPGTKNTVDDLKALKRSRLYDDIMEFDGPIMGVCGGYQMLGEKLIDRGNESTSDSEEEIDGFGLLPVVTYFDRTNKKRTEQVKLEVTGDKSLLSDIEGKIEGYEIHMGKTVTKEDEEIEKAFEHDGVIHKDVIGTYLHGLFMNDEFRNKFIKSLKGETKDIKKSKNKYEKLKEIFEKNIEFSQLLK
ncbi:MAG: Cobyric acid synthase CobQ [Candidatus Methanohalarchaeum thermophilum]|uniref:Probable cobyric acid synthase n=1 Tax=Methanohalarchaeum thermophilum TaxID=1903181 RepID=A0A1Q6DUN6_METT1|nr:MAG: Cobyric acid synthase CobQ [Candidatus Methanohalarchaeum thermophilum]